MSAYFEVKGLSHQYAKSTTFEGVEFGLDKGGTLSLLGESGQGKSTLLLCLAGLVCPRSGYIRLGERVLFSDKMNCPAELRKMGFVFQEHSLFPHLNVRDNISFGLKRERGDEVRDLMDMVGLSGCEKKFPFEISGGQQQRTAIARALASSPELLLFDEPFAHLDRRLRFNLRQEIRQILKSKSMTAIFVTHDQEEAFDMGDRVAVLNKGAVEQMDTPFNLYHFPQSLFVARFIGSGLFLSGKIFSDADGYARTPLGDISVRNKGMSGVVDLYLPAGGVRLSKQSRSPSLKGKVIRKFFRSEGSRYDICLMEVDRIFENLISRQNFSPGEEVFITFEREMEATAFYSER